MRGNARGGGSRTVGTRIADTAGECKSDCSFRSVSMWRGAQTGVEGAASGMRWTGMPVALLMGVGMASPSSSVSVDPKHVHMSALLSCCGSTLCCREN